MTERVIKYSYVFGLVFLVTVFVLLIMVVNGISGVFTVLTIAWILLIGHFTGYAVFGLKKSRLMLASSVLFMTWSLLNILIARQIISLTLVESALGPRKIAFSLGLAQITFGLSLIKLKGEYGQTAQYSGLLLIFSSIFSFTYTLLGNRYATLLGVGYIMTFLSLIFSVRLQRNIIREDSYAMGLSQLKKPPSLS